MSIFRKVPFFYCPSNVIIYWCGILWIVSGRKNLCSVPYIFRGYLVKEKKLGWSLLFDDHIVCGGRRGLEKQLILTLKCVMLGRYDLQMVGYRRLAGQLYLINWLSMYQNTNLLRSCNCIVGLTSMMHWANICEEVIKTAIRKGPYKAWILKSVHGSCRKSFAYKFFLSRNISCLNKDQWSNWDMQLGTWPS